MVRNILKNGAGRYLLILLIVGIALVPIVSSLFYGGNNQLITTKNFDDNATYQANLLSYGDANNCGDSDNGIKPDVNGSVYWFDPNTDGNGGTAWYSYQDFCAANGILVELGCSDQFLVDGNQYNGYVAAVAVDCNAIGYTSCNSFLRRCV